MIKYLLLIRNFIDKLVTGNLKDLLKVFNTSTKIVQKEINNLLMGYMVDGKLTISKNQRYQLLKKLDKTLIKEAKFLGERDIEVTTKILSDTAKESYYRTNYLVGAGMENPIDPKPITDNKIKALVNTPIKEEMFSSRIWKNKEKLVKQVRFSVEKALINGTDPKKLAREIKRQFGVSAYESKRLIFNEVSRVVRQSQDYAYEQQGVKKVMYDATLDNKTSKFCQEHDGRIYNFGEHPKIPEESHIGCRSDILPLIDGWTPKHKRENIKNEDGVKPIIDYSNYEEWKKEKGFN
jgi:SPP1 gp7 family putative phage head morphogenesis protein